MRISPLSVKYQDISPVKVKNINAQSQVQFQGKHSGLKWGAVIFGGMATLGAVGGTIIMSGGTAAIPLALAYIGLGAGSGAIIGHQIDKGAEKAGKENKFDKKA